MQEAEAIAKKENAEFLHVISGVGVRQYYKKLGYKLKEPYMIKKL
jgi:elongator complex protein 3